MFSCKDSNACRACSESNQETDTVKVNLNFASADKDKENRTPTSDVKQSSPVISSELDRKLQAQEVEIRRLEEEKNREQERLRQERQEREALEERRRQEEEAEERLQREQEQKRLEEERRIKDELERQQEVERQEAEQRAREEEQRRQEEELARVAKEKEQAELQSKLQSFLKSAGFKDVNEKKKVKTGMLSSGFTYPLHAAVKSNDPNIVEVLLRSGANRDLTDSKKLKPLDLAQKISKNDSHKQEIAVLTTFSPA